MFRAIRVFSFCMLMVGYLAATAGVATASGEFLAIYNDGRAQVKEGRSVNLPQGAAAIVFGDMPTTMDPTSVRAEADGVVFEDVAYAYKPVTPAALLDAYVGKEVTVYFPEPGQGDTTVKKQAVLLSNEGVPVFKVGDEVFIAPSYDAIILPGLPKGYSADAKLTLTASSSVAGKTNVYLSYLLGGLNWSADYNLTVDKSGDTASLDAWATVRNDSGKDFTRADVRLVAGDVNRVANKIAPAPVRTMASQEMVMGAPMPAAQEDFSQYHVYTPGRRISIPGNGTKQVSLFSAPKVAVTQALSSEFQAGPAVRRGELEQPVSMKLIFRNIAENTLGVPMPAGRVRVFMPMGDGTQLLAGESYIDHTAVGKDVRLTLGRSFDVNVARTQTDHQKIGKNVYEISWKIEVTNASDDPHSLKLVEKIPGQWEILESDTEYVKKDAGSIVFKLDKLNAAPRVVNYTVRISY